MPIKRQRFGMRDFPLLHEPLAASHARRDGMMESCETNEGGRVMEERLRGERLARVLLFVTPLFFASNMLVARATADFMPPVAELPRAIRSAEWIETSGTLTGIANGPAPAVQV